MTAYKELDMDWDHVSLKKDVTLCDKSSGNVEITFHMFW